MHFQYVPLHPLVSRSNLKFGKLFLWKQKKIQKTLRARLKTNNKFKISNISYIRHQQWKGAVSSFYPSTNPPRPPPPHATQVYVLNHYLFRSSSTCLRCPFMICNVSSSCCILVSNYIGQLKQSKVRITEELCCVMDYKQVSLEGTNEYSEQKVH